MNVRQVLEKLNDLGACSQSCTWLIKEASGGDAVLGEAGDLDARRFYEECPRPDWTVWLVTKLGFSSERICACLREVLELHRDTEAVRIADRYRETWLTGTSFGSVSEEEYKKVLPYVSDVAAACRNLLFGNRSNAFSVVGAFACRLDYASLNRIVVKHFPWEEVEARLATVTK